MRLVDTPIPSILAALRDTLTLESFASGFLKPRNDLGWPRGVQEDEDVRWSWSTKAPTPAAAMEDVAPAPTERLRGRVHRFDG